MTWDIWIDTGGTFTDCVARDADGAIHRAKILSSSALRGRVIDVPEPDVIRTDVARSLPGDAVDGLRYRAMSGAASMVDAPDPQLVECDSARGVIRVPGAGSVIAPGDTFELRADVPAPLLAAHLVTGTAIGRALPDLRLRLATTKGTNALLERRGAPTVLFVTRGFGDLLVIGNQQRPDLFALRIDRSPPLYDAVVEVTERLDADGVVQEPIDVDAAVRAAVELRAAGVRSAAIALMHSYVDDTHERRLADALRVVGFDYVTTSARGAPLIGVLPRAQTAVVDAYLGPIVASYLDQVEHHVGAGSVHVMTSAGGVVRADAFSARDSLLSGPAGGVAGAAAAGRRSGFDRIIGFDMGGTSTDVARYDGDFEYHFEHEVAGARIIAPALAIETVAAGGGSICRYHEGRLRVGPESASADPGPACYGAGGPLTLTDVNLLLGRLDVAQFAIPVSVDAAAAALDELVETVARDRGEDVDRAAVLEGLLAIGNDRMASAIEQVSIRCGYDPAEFALVAFGGAGGQHACAVAEALGMRRVLVPPDASLLSAVGLGGAVIERFAQRQVLETLDTFAPELDAVVEALGAEATDALRAEGVAARDVIVRRRLVNVRLAGQETALTLDFDGAVDDAAIRHGFTAQYRARYGYDPPEKAVEVESIRVVASTRPSVNDLPREGAPPRSTPPTVERRRVRVAGAWTSAPAHERATLAPAESVDGPALIIEPRSTTVIEPGWTAAVDAHGAIVIERAATVDSPERDRPHADVVRQELLVYRLTSIAEEMGELLRRTAVSTNVRERLDFSCAVLDAEGQLIVNAPHIPVHLGALGVCVRAVASALELRAGDVALTNHPAWGGSHLPDVTVISPVFVDGTLIGYAANRAHHAEIGGARPGSMPPAATRLVEEGVVLPPMHVIREGQDRFDAIAAVLSAGPYPSRSVDDNLADLRAQVAANRHGVTALIELARRCASRDELTTRMTSLADRADDTVRSALRAFPDGCYEAREALDDGATIQVAMTIEGDSVIVDFAGSAATHPGNLNATPSIVRAAVLYVLRLLIARVGRTAPLNEGMMRAVDLRIPPGLLDPPFTTDPTECPAVVGGNVETSQRIVETLIKALGLAAGSQGTMNNVLFGTSEFGYYETVGGGSGAGPEFDGSDAVHTHMTNTRITDPEVLEHRFPVVLETFAVRRGSGGAGRFRGGAGVVRQFRFTAPVELSILSQHRGTGPYGLAGGEPGRPGINRIRRANGREATLDASDGCSMAPGDRLVLETPGGGGFGSPEDD